MKKNCQTLKNLWAEQKSKLPKLATMLLWWKNSNQSEISDEKWSKLICENPNFYILA